MYHSHINPYPLLRSDPGSNKSVLILPFIPEVNIWYVRNFRTSQQPLEKKRYLTVPADNCALVTWSSQWKHYIDTSTYTNIPNMKVGKMKNTHWKNLTAMPVMTVNF